MFCLDLSPTFRATVRFEATGADGARVVHAFAADFVRLTEDEMRTLATEIAAQQLDDRTIARRLLRGWGDDVRDAAGNALPYTPANVDRVLNVHGVPGAMLHAWRAAQPRAAAGN